jgi:signal transduction histidine kinase
VVEPFFRVDESRGDAFGFGLGLAIVEEIVSSHDGRLELLPNQPHGLIARITLACAPSLAACSNPSAAAIPARRA